MKRNAASSLSAARRGASKQPARNTMDADAALQPQLPPMWLPLKILWSPTYVYRRNVASSLRYKTWTPTLPLHSKT